MRYIEADERMPARWVVDADVSNYVVSSLTPIRDIDDHLRDAVAPDIDALLDARLVFAAFEEHL